MRGEECSGRPAGRLPPGRGFAAGFPPGSNKRYALADAASCALSVFFFQAPCLEFQRRMQQETSRSKCHTLFGVQAIPCDNRIRDLLDGVDLDRFADLFPLCLGAVREQGARPQRRATSLAAGLSRRRAVLLPAPVPAGPR